MSNLGGRTPTVKSRVPPQNLESEIATLGAMLLDPGESLSRVLEFLRPDDFYHQAHVSIFRAILQLFDRSEEIDLITVTQELRSDSTLDKVGGASYISSLTTAVPTATNIEYYARIVKETSVRRQLIGICNQTISSAYDDTRASRLIVDEAEQGIFEITENFGRTDLLHARDVVVETVGAIERLYKADNKDDYTGIPTGFSDLDHMLNGLQKSEFIIIGARPSVGKTSIALNMAANMAIRYKISVGFFTLEMSYMALMQRLLSSEARIGSQKLRSGMLTLPEFVQLTDAASLFYDTNFWIVDTPTMKLLDLRSQARRLVTRNNVDVIFIDYLTLLSSEHASAPRHEQIAEVSRSLKALARELGIPVVALSQLTRDSEGRRPNLASIRESGAIEQDADVVIFLHRERASELDREENDTPVEVIVAKQRNGPVGTVKLMFVARYTKFESLDPHH